MLPSYNTQQNISICQDDSVIIGNNTYFNSGIYIDSLSTFLGVCDSIITTNLIVSKPTGLIVDNNPLINLSALGGTPPYIYQAFGPNGSILNTNNNNGSVITINPIINGVYSLVITDNIGCVSDTVSYTVEFVLSIDEDLIANKKIKKITNILGQSTKLKYNTPLLIIFEDGTIKKITIIK
tara:strand:- start:752 stop:1294 length:543 start_codon:yes stop_codon:yes gene_type:complete